VKWSECSVRGILTNQQYAGALVYNKTTQKLKTPTRKNPKEEWIVTPGAYPPIVEPELFERARAVLDKRKRRSNPEEMLARLRELYDEYGLISSNIVQFADECPGPGAYASKFGGLSGAFQQMFKDVVARVREDVFRAISESVRLVDEYEDFIVINRDFTIVIQPSIPIPYGYGESWTFRPDRRSVVDITLGVPLSDESGEEILGYLALPRLMVPEKYVRLSGASNARIELQAHSGLDFIRELTK
jgi:hypothetical protein